MPHGTAEWHPSPLLCALGDTLSLSNCAGHVGAGRRCAGKTENPPGDAGSPSPKGSPCRQLSPRRGQGRWGGCRRGAHLGPVPGPPLVAAGVVLAPLLHLRPGRRVALALRVGAGHSAPLGPCPAAGRALQSVVGTWARPARPGPPTQRAPPPCRPSEPPGLLEPGALGPRPRGK